MNNGILEFFIKMKDLTQGAFQKIHANVKSIENRTTNMIGGNKRLAVSYSELERRAASAAQKMRDATDPSRVETYRRYLERLNREIRNHSVAMNGGGSGGGGGFMGGIGKRLLVGAAASALIAGTGSFLTASAQSAIKHESTNKSFEVLTGNKGIGGALAGQLNDLQQQTVLGPEVFKNAQTMLGFGITAEKIIPNLKMLGDVSMGDAEKLQSLTLAFSQVQAAGKLTGQDLLQFINAGFNPLKTISETTGVSMANLKKKMEDGAISSDMVTKAFESATGKGGLFNNMLEQMGGTTGGKIAQLQGGFEALKIAVGERMKPAINWFVGGLTNIVSKVKSWFEVPLEKKLTDQIYKIQGLQAQLTASNTTHARQIELLKELEQINPNIVAGIDKQNISYSKLAENINNVTGALKSKIFMEKFDKSNADTLTSFSSAQQKADESFAASMSIVGMFPDIAADQKMSLSEKQIAAKRRLESRVAADPKKGIVSAHGQGVVLSDDLMTLNRMITSFQENSAAQQTIKLLNPKINEINSTKNSLAAQIDKFTGVKSMTAAGIPGGSTAGAAATTGGSKGDVASGITGGGPRVININGVKFMEKLADNLEINNQGDLEKIEQRFAEMFLRILNSGASVQ